MAKVAAVELTVRSAVAFAPNTAASMRTEPDPPATPVAVTTSWPLAFVVPDAGVSVTLPAPVLVIVTVALGTTLPPASFAVMVNVTGDPPSSESVVPLDSNVTVEPTTCTGICADAVPAVAVIVAVRLDLLAPEAKVTFALPVASVMTVADPKTPLSACMVTVISGIAALAAFNAVTVMVAEVEPSDLMVVLDVDRSSEAAVVGVGALPATAYPLDAVIAVVPS